jgi:chaperone BCS1
LTFPIYFNILREKVSILDTAGPPGNGKMFAKEETIKIRAYAPYPEVIIKFIEDAREKYSGQLQEGVILIYVPNEKDFRAPSRGSPWRFSKAEPERLIRIVILDGRIKKDLLADVNEFLSEDTMNFYKGQGTPYSRGYLFVGPPGSGKSSVTKAMACSFGLSIYMFLANDKSITDEQLMYLFLCLPDRCMVVIEDIEEFFLRRRAFSLAILLGVLDGKSLPYSNFIYTKKFLGIASQCPKGRILVMTTNHPEKLPNALIRDGRIDYIVDFGNATQAQAKNLFIRIYTKPKKMESSLSSAQGPAEEKAKLDSKVALDLIAETFSKLILEKRFSIAQLQGFLIKRRKDPKKALEEIAS